MTIRFGADGGLYAVFRNEHEADSWARIFPGKLRVSFRGYLNAYQLGAR